MLGADGARGMGGFPEEVFVQGTGTSPRVEVFGSCGLRGGGIDGGVVVVFPDSEASKTFDDCARGE